MDCGIYLIIILFQPQVSISWNNNKFVGIPKWEAKVKCSNRLRAQLGCKILSALRLLSDKALAAYYYGKYSIMIIIIPNFHLERASVLLVFRCFPGYERNQQSRGRCVVKQNHPNELRAREQ